MFGTKPTETHCMVPGQAHAAHAGSFIAAEEPEMFLKSTNGRRPESTYFHVALCPTPVCLFEDLKRPTSVIVHSHFVSS